MKRSELRDRLRAGTQRVVFIKKNGERRVMVATLRNDVLAANLGKNYTPRKEPENLLTVWDCDAQGWRRINVDTLESVEDFAQVME